MSPSLNLGNGLSQDRATPQEHGHSSPHQAAQWPITCVTRPHLGQQQLNGPRLCRHLLCSSWPLKHGVGQGSQYIPPVPEVRRLAGHARGVLRNRRYNRQHRGRRLLCFGGPVRLWRWR